MKIIYLTLCLFLISCATPTPYQPANYLGRGYKDQKLDKDKYRVSFQGNRITDRETVETYLFYRAAEVTAQNGFQFFTMVNMNTDRRTNYDNHNPVVFGTVLNQQQFPYYVYGQTPFLAHRGSRFEYTEYDAVAFVSMTNKKPKEKSELFYEAKEVIKNLEERVTRSEN